MLSQQRMKHRAGRKCGGASFNHPCQIVLLTWARYRQSPGHHSGCPPALGGTYAHEGHGMSVTIIRRCVALHGMSLCALKCLPAPSSARGSKAWWCIALRLATNPMPEPCRTVHQRPNASTRATRITPGKQLPHARLVGSIRRRRCVRICTASWDRCRGGQVRGRPGLAL